MINISTNQKRGPSGPSIGPRSKWIAALNSATSVCYANPNFYENTLMVIRNLNYLRSDLKSSSENYDSKMKMHLLIYCTLGGGGGGGGGHVLGIVGLAQN